MHIICGVPVSGNVMNEVVFWQIKRLLPALCDCCTVVEERHITSGPSEQPGYLLDSCYFFSGAKLNVLVANLGALIALTIFLTSSVVTTIVPAGLLGLGPFVFSELGFFLLLQLDAM